MWFDDSVASNAINLVTDFNCNHSVKDYEWFSSESMPEIVIICDTFSNMLVLIYYLINTHILVCGIYNL